MTLTQTRSILTDMIVDGAINTNDIASDAVGTAKIAANGIEATHIGADAVGTAKIAAGGIEATHFADDAIGTAKIAAGGVEATHFANDAIGTAKIAADGVQASHLHASALDSHLIVGNSQIFTNASNTCSYAITGASLKFAWGGLASQQLTKKVSHCLILSDSIMRFVVISATDESLWDSATTNSRISYCAIRT